MANIKTVAILGAGSAVGNVLAKHMSSAPVRLLLCDNSADTILELTAAIQAENPQAEAEAVNCNYTASWEADLIFLAIPRSEIYEKAEKIKEVVTGKTVVWIPGISAGNPAETDETGAEELQQILPHSQVVNAFGFPFINEMANQTIPGNPKTIKITGTHTEAVKAVAGLVKMAGFNPIFKGDLFEAEKPESKSAASNGSRAYRQTWIPVSAFFM
jgi:8-hydroxy-5-deazaflavin:NADPH oxidoreductase